MLLLYLHCKVEHILMTKSQEDWTQSSESAYKVLSLSTYSFYSM